MRYFWEYGYEKTSINDLVDCMGIHRRSMYDTFGDKRQLFQRAVERYRRLLNDRFQTILASTETAKQSMQNLFGLVLGDDVKSMGCLIVNMAVELAPRDPEVDQMAQESFARLEGHLTELIRKGQANGEFATTYDARERAESLHNSLIGLRVLARTTTDKSKLQRIAATAISSLQ